MVAFLIWQRMQPNRKNGIYHRLAIPFFSLLLIIGCSHTSRIYSDRSAETISQPRYSAIYYIHADNDYLYHQSDGSPVRANEHILESAIDVAEQAISGEVFIFHQKSQRKWLRIFPRNNNEFYYYKNGKLQQFTKYRYTSTDVAFMARESSLIQEVRFTRIDEAIQSYFFYFGHEIPHELNSNYHRSTGSLPVSTESFAKGVRNFTSNGQPFDLIVLSTCNNATATMANQLIQSTKFMLASPQNLHLSHIDTNAMRLLESTPTTTPHTLALEIASRTFDRLSTEVFTAITLSVIDMDQIKDYISELDGYIKLNRSNSISNYRKDNVDCKEFDFFRMAKYSEGVTTFFRPAQFGRSANATTHSGWGCR